jgi:hypothetical protein
LLPAAGAAHFPRQVYVYFAGACVCLLTSGVCHLLGCCQRHIAEMVWRFDYAGIAVLIVASFVPAMYYAFLCQPFWRNFYLMTTISMGECLCAREPATLLPSSGFLGLLLSPSAVARSAAYSFPAWTPAKSVLVRPSNHPRTVGK